MKRYMIQATHHYEWADGEWVTAKDALAAVAQVRQETEIATWAKAGVQRNLDVEQARREELETCAQIVEMSNGLSTTQIAAAIRARGEAPTWTAEQVSQVSAEADRLAAKFEARGEGE